MRTLLKRSRSEPGLQTLVVFFLQTFATSKGARYTVRFALAAHPDHLGADQILVSAGDFSGRFVTSRSAGRGRPNWIVIIFTFMATGFSSTIRFEADDDAVVGPLISSVVISEGNDV